MANTVYDNFYLSNEIEDQYKSHLDLQTFCTVDNALEGTAGMLRKINVYKATDGTEKLAMGAGNSKSIEVGFTPREYRIQLAQNRFKYYDEQAMTDPQLVPVGTKHMGTDMFNTVNADIYGEFAKATQVVVVTKLNFDAFADAQSVLALEDLEGVTIFAFVSPADVAELRKELKDTLQYVEAFAKNGYIGTVAGVNIYTKKDAVSGSVYMATKEAVTLFNKKGTEVEQERDPNTRENSIYSRKYYLAALTDETKDVKIFKGTATVSTDTTASASKTYYSKVGGSGSTVPGTPSTNYNDVTRRRVRNTNTLSYDFRKLISNDNHHLNVLLGQEYIITEQRTFNTWVDGLPDFYTAEQAWAFMGAGSNASSSNMNYAADDILLSYFGRINYDFKGKYMLSATMRGDGSSKFSKGQKWGYFPSVAASWRLSDEWGMKDLRWLDNLKLRYSFGTAGNNNIPTGMGGLTQLYEVGTGSSFIYGDPTYWTPNGNGASESFMANANLTWETTYSHNLGLDFGFWRNRLSGSVEVYQNTTEDILMRYPVSGSGYSFQYRNAGTIRNRGLEVSVSAVLLEKAKYGLNFNANIAFNRSRIMDLAGLDTYSQSSGWNNNVTDYYAVLGGAIGDVHGYTTLGRYEVGDFDLDYYAETGKWKTLDGSNCAGVVGDMRPGSLKLLCDADGNPIQGRIGNVQPKFTGGFSLSGYAYGFDIAANFTYSYGNKVFNANNVEFTSSQKYTGKGVIRNLSEVMALGKRWTNIDWTTGDVITDPEALAAANRTTTMWSPYMPQTVVHSWLLEDASFLRLSSLTIGYTLPSSWTRKVRLSKVRFYATGTNLFCWTPYSGFDPEVDTRRATPMTPNVDYSAYPKSRSWVFGANISF